MQPKQSFNWKCTHTTISYSGTFTKRTKQSKVSWQTCIRINLPWYLLRIFYFEKDFVCLKRWFFDGGIEINSLFSIISNDSILQTYHPSKAEDINVLYLNLPFLKGLYNWLKLKLFLCRYSLPNLKQKIILEN